MAGTVWLEARRIGFDIRAVRQLKPGGGYALAPDLLHGRLHLWAYEQNLSARRFYERLGGVITLRHAELALDGTEVNAVRYCWSDLSGLAVRGA